MAELTAEQEELALEIMREYLKAPSTDGNRSLVEEQAERDQLRVEVIEQYLKPLLEGYLDGHVPLAEFKPKVDGINKQNSLWGFKGIKGQMFFNMVVNVADDADECDQELKSALRGPTNEQIASSRIKTFASYVKRLGDQWVEGGNSRRGAPKLGSIPFFLSYFWQIQDRNTWPVYYTNAVNTMGDLNLWQPSGDLAEDYVCFKRIHEELVNLFTKESGRSFGLYDVEHVFWSKGGNPYEASRSATDTPSKDVATVEVAHGRLPDSYVPPIVAILPDMARHDERLVEMAKRTGTTLDRAFEKHVSAAFTILGYETKLLGQGQGRVPDGLALALDDNYAILWDGKVRANGYSMGTDDRTIREYITTQSRELKRRRALRNIYYCIVSSTFANDFDESVRSIKMETDVSEVVLMEAEALVAMVDAKLREPIHITLGPDGLQRLFSASDVLTASTVMEQFS